MTCADAGQMNLTLNYAREHLLGPDEHEPGVLMGRCTCGVHLAFRQMVDLSTSFGVHIRTFEDRN
jgi:hypothetical protein